MSLNLTIATPEKMFFTGEAEQIIITSTDGEMGVLPGHLPMVVALGAAPIRIQTADGWREAALSGGFAEIETDKVVVMADTAEWPEEIEINRAMEAKTRAEERMQNRLSEIEYLRTQIALQRALARLKVKNRN